MIPEIGNFAIILAFCFALLQGILPLFGYYQRKSLFFTLSTTAAIGQCGFLVFAMLCLIISFLNNDMSVAYVQEHSHQLLPFIYRVGAAWGGHEGSLLLWCLILSGWTVAFVVFSAGIKSPLPPFFIGGRNGHLAQENMHPFEKEKSLSHIAHKNVSSFEKQDHPAQENMRQLENEKSPSHIVHENISPFEKGGLGGIYILSILGFISTGFLAFLFFTSDPFKRIFPTAPLVGDDLTPILQDPGLIFHPPMLYLGYVGFAIGFAFAISALIEGKLDKTWVQACRPWVIMPWAFLSFGIVLGSWWAYRELGWGGWWFWDPVENASLLPWLSATAFIHALIVSEKRGVFKGWTLLLAIVTFALSLLGTFLVRSGILVSVHAFASDPTRGLFLLCYLAIIIGGAFVFYGYRIKHFYQAPNFELFSRETFLLINTVIMLTAVATIMLGTLYPIILDALNMGKISVGEPYFNTVFLPIILPLLFLMGFAPHVTWGQQSLQKLRKKLGLNFFLTLIAGLIGPSILGFDFHLLTTLGVFFGLWIITATGQYVWQLKQSQGKVGLQYWSMIIAHLGIAVLALGVTINKSYSEERQVKMLPGETVSIAGYQFHFNNLEETKGPNYKSITATFAVQKKNSSSFELLSAQQRVYRSHDQTLSKPGILVNPWRDLYLALGAPLSDNSWSVRIYYKPCVRWIWFGGFMLLVGGLLSLLTLKKKSRD